MRTTTRRRFLRTAALGLSAAASPRAARALVQRSNPQAPPPSIVDWHAHWVGPHVVELLNARSGPRPPQGAGWFDIDARLRDMDANAVQRQVIAWVGGAFDGALPPAEARPLWRAQNDDVSALVRAHPRRFRAAVRECRGWPRRGARRCGCAAAARPRRSARARERRPG